jgi:hypothetical protein
MGRVWQARDQLLHRDVAIKQIIPPADLVDAERQDLRERSLREARAIAKLDHPNVVRVLDVLSIDGDPWIVMEYVPSRSLQETLATDGPVPPVRAAEIGLAVLGALGAAHRAGLVHRDVKPANILLGYDGRVVLGDFGLAIGHDDSNLTRPNIVLGTAAYIAPEQAMGGATGPEGDLWSLGATLYAAVEGNSPYARQSSLLSFTALATEPPPVAKHAGPLTPVLDGLLRKDPTERISAETADQLLRQAIDGRWDDQGTPARALELASANGDQPKEGSRFGGQRRRWLVGALVALLLLGVAVGVPLAKRVLSSQPAVSTDNAHGVEYSASADGAALLPITWYVYQDSTGFAVPAPKDWPISRDGAKVEFREPHGDRLLAVSQTNSPNPDPLAELTAQEKALLTSGQHRSYRRVGIVPADYYLGAADWDWTYTNGSNELIHVRQRSFSTAKQKGYTISWSTPESAWPSGERDFWRILGGFRPAALPSSTPSQRSSTVQIKPSATPSPRGYRIVGIQSKRCLDVADLDTIAPVQLQIWDCSPTRDRNQRWTFAADGTIRLLGRCMEVAGGATNNGVAIQLATCVAGTPGQRFALNDQEQLVNAGSGMCLDVIGMITANGGLLQQYPCNGGVQNQKWALA